MVPLAWRVLEEKTGVHAKFFFLKKKVRVPLNGTRQIARKLNRVDVLDCYCIFVRRWQKSKRVNMQDERD